MSIQDQENLVYDDFGLGLSSDFWDKFFSEQLGLVGQSGGLGQSGPGQTQFFQGLDYQRGAGPFASFFKTLAKLVMPTAKKVAKAVTKQALSTGTSLATDALAGQLSKERLAEHGSRAALNLLHKADRALAKPRPKPKAKPKPKSRSRPRTEGRGLRPGKVYKRQTGAGQGPGSFELSQTGQNQEFAQLIKMTICNIVL